MLRDGDIIEMWGLSEKTNGRLMGLQVTLEGEPSSSQIDRTPAGVTITPEFESIDVPMDDAGAHSSEDEDFQELAFLSDGLERVIDRDCIRVDDDGTPKLTTYYDDDLSAHEYFEPTEVSSGVEEHTLVRMADGSAKMIKDITAGDYVLDRYGTPQEVEDVEVGWSDLYEVSEYSTSQWPSDFCHQSVVVGAAQQFEVCIDQCELNSYSFVDCDDSHDYPRYDVAYRHLVREVVVDQSGDNRYVTKAHQTLLSEQCMTGSEENFTTSAAVTREIAQSKLAKKVDAKIPRHYGGQKCDKIFWYPEARDLVAYKDPTENSKLNDVERERISANIRATTSNLDLLNYYRIPASIVEDNSTRDSFRSFTREILECALRHCGFSQGRMEDFLYLAGAWLGGGRVGNFSIATKSTDEELIVRLAEVGTSLDLNCDLEHRPIREEKLESYWQSKEWEKFGIDLIHPRDASRIPFRKLLNYTQERARKRREKSRKHRRETGKDPTSSTNSSNFSQDFVNIIVHYGNQSLYVSKYRNIWILLAISGIREIDKGSGRCNPEWLFSAPVAWRESFLAGIIESYGCKKFKSRLCLALTRGVQSSVFVTEVARSLGITTKQSILNYSKASGLEQKTLYLIQLYDNEALDRVRSLVASPEKNSISTHRTRQSLKYRRKPDLLRFRFVPLRKQGRVLKLYLRQGSEYASTCGILLLAEGAVW